MMKNCCKMMQHINLRINDEHRTIDKILLRQQRLYQIPHDLLNQDLKVDKKSDI